MNRSSDIESEGDYPEEYEGQGSNTFFEKQYESNPDGINEIIFTQLEQMAKTNIELRNYDQGFDDIDRCIEHLLSIVPEKINSTAFQDYMTRTLNFLNDFALKLLQLDHVKDSIKILEKCQDLSQPDKYGVHPILRNLTYNHLGCCYRRIGKLEKSLYYLEKAEQLLIYVDKAEGSGVTHINMCAVLSQMGNHQRALHHAKQAVSSCAYDFVQLTRENKNKDPKLSHKKATMLGIAYHNLGVEEDFCHQYESAIQSYYQAFKLIEEHCGTQEPLSAKFRKAYEEAKEKFTKRVNKNMGSPTHSSPNLKALAIDKRTKSPPREFKAAKKRSKSRYTPNLNSGEELTKVYLKNSQIVIAKKYDPLSAKMSLSQGLSPKAKQINPISKSKLFVSLGPNVPMMNSSQIRTRPATAKAQTSKLSDEYGMPRGFETRTPTNQYYGGFSKDDSKHLRSEAIQELEQLGIEEEDDLAHMNDMKMNRISFLENLNSYKPEPRKSGSIFTANNTHLSFGEQESSKSSIQRVPSAKNKNKDFQIKRKHPAFENKPTSRTSAAIRLQSKIRGYLVRRFIAKHRPKEGHVIFAVCKHLKTEPSLISRTRNTECLVAITYSVHNQGFEVDIKDQVNRKFYHKFIEYHPINKTKISLHHELKTFSERIIEDLRFNGPPSDRQHSDSDKNIKLEDYLKRNPTPQLIGQITERSEGSEIEPILATSLMSKNYQGPKKGESMSRNNSEILSSSESSSVKPIIGSLPHQPVIGKPSDSKRLRPESGKKIVMRPPSDTESLNTDEQISNKKAEPVRIPAVKTSKVNIPENRPGPLSKRKNLISQKITYKGKEYEIKLTQRTGDSVPDDKAFVLSCFDFEQDALYNKLYLPKDLVDDNTDIKAIMDMIEIAPEDNALLFKKGLSVLRQEKRNKLSQKGMFDIAEHMGTTESQASSHLGIAPLIGVTNSVTKKPEENDNLISINLNNGAQTVRIELILDEKSSEIMVVPEMKHSKLGILTIPVKELGFKKATREELFEKKETLLKPNLRIQNGKLIYSKPSTNEPVLTKGGSKKHVVIKEENQPVEKQKIEDETDELPDINDPEVQEATLKIQAAMIRKKERMEAKAQKQKEKEEKRKAAQKEAEEKKKKKEEEKDELPDINDPEVQQATLKIQAAMIRKKERMAEKEEKQKAKEAKKKGSTEAQKKAVPKKQEKDELPDITDPEVQGATLKIQAAMIRKKERMAAKEQKQKEKEAKKQGVQKQPSQKKVVPKVEEKKDELPDITDPEVQGATLKIQAAMIRKKERMAAKEQKQKEKEAKKQEVQKQPSQKKVVPKVEEKKDELPDINDPEVQDATMKIQAAMIRKKERMAAKEQKQKEKEAKKQAAERAKAEAEKANKDELPDINDPEVQEATLKIQAAMIRKKERVAAKAEKQKEKEAKKQAAQKQPSQKNVTKQPEVEKDELPDINDPEVQKATLKIEKAMIRKQQRAAAKAEKQKEKDAKKLAAEKAKAEEEKAKKDELPDINDPEVQGATLKIQAAMIRKKERMAAKEQKQKEKEAKKQGVQKQPSQKKVVPKVEEKKDELPDITDPEVQGATLKIQAAMIRKKERMAAKEQKQKEKEAKKQAAEKAKAEAEKAKKDELPDINDPAVQDATLKIQAAMIRKQQRVAEKAEKQKEKEAKKLAAEKAKAEETKKKAEEKNELPDINDPEVQQATLKIQAAMIRKQERTAAKAEKLKEKEAKKQAALEKEKANQIRQKQLEEKGELPDINDPEVQGATLKIQAAMIRKQQREAAKAQKQKEKEEKQKKLAPQVFTINHNNDNELPDINDPEVQEATLKIQAAMIRKQQRAAAKVEKEKQREAKRQAAQLEKARLEQAEKERMKQDPNNELPDINDPEVQDATIKIQEAMKRKQKRMAEKAERQKERENKRAAQAQEKKIPAPTLAEQGSTLQKQGSKPDIEVSRPTTIQKQGSKPEIIIERQGSRPDIPLQKQGSSPEIKRFENPDSGDRRISMGQNRRIMGSNQQLSNETTKSPFKVTPRESKDSPKTVESPKKDDSPIKRNSNDRRDSITKGRKSLSPLDVKKNQGSEEIPDSPQPMTNEQRDEKRKKTLPSEQPKLNIEKEDPNQKSTRRYAGPIPVIRVNSVELADDPTKN